MSLTSLFDLLDRVEPHRPLWVSPSDETSTADAIRELVSVDLRSLRGRRVAIDLDSSTELARCLVMLDGVCESMLLLPGGLDADQCRSLRVQAGVDSVINSDELNELRLHSAATLSEQERSVATRWILATSGTTGRPKLVGHTLSSLTRTASFDSTVGAQHTWSSLYNLTGFAGLQVFLQAWCGGSRFVLHDDQASLADRVARMSRLGVTALSATPTMWRKILMASDARSLPLRRITLGGEIADQKILNALAETFPTAKITQIYASTEAGVGFSVRDGLAGFPTAYLDNPPAGVEIRVDDNRLLLRNPKSTQRFLDHALELHREDGFIDTGDRLQRIDDRFEFLGRANGSINVGGNKVHPEEVEHFLMGCQGVVQAHVYAKKNAFTGSLVAADVVCDQDTVCDQDRTLIRKRLVAECRERLDAYKVPAIIRIVDSMETNAAGKLKRSA